MKFYVRLPLAIGLMRDIRRGVASYAQPHGHEVLFDDPDYPVRTDLAARGIAGVILADTEARVPARLGALRVPLVNVSGYRVSHLPSVLPDNVAIGRLAAEHLLERGYRHFGFAGMPRHAYSIERQRGFTDAVHGAGHAVVDLVDFATGRGLPDSTEQAVDDWIAASPRPLGVMACNDLRAARVLESCGRQRVPVPQDVAVVGVDDDDVVCQTTSPLLSSIALQGTRIGFMAAALLEQLIGGAASPAGPLRVSPGELYIRGSSDGVATRDEIVLEAMKFIQTHVAQPLEVDAVVSAVAVSRRTLERHFDAALGRSPAAEICRAKLARAQQLLAGTDLALGRIAFLVGLRYTRHLNMLFRRQFDQTPLQYRAQFRGPVEGPSILG